jgi:hypothetical protein
MKLSATNYFEKISLMRFDVHKYVNLSEKVKRLKGWLLKELRLRRFVKIFGT